MNRLQIAQYIALGATAFSLIGLCCGGLEGKTLGVALMGIGFFAGLVSYIFGGLGTALRMAWSIASWGWVLVPFPYRLMAVVFTMIFAVFAFIFVPIIPVRKAYKQSRGY